MGLKEEHLDTATKSNEANQYYTSAWPVILKIEINNYSCTLVAADTRGYL